jgi:hypothetical protein
MDSDAIVDRPMRMIVLARGEPGGFLASLDDGPLGPSRLESLAEGIATSRNWRADRPLTLVVRPGPNPMLAAFGRFDGGDEARLDALRWQIETILPRTIYLDGDAVAEAALVLADRLREVLGADGVARARFVGIPRGGLIVLGLVAYALDVTHEQLEGSSPPAPATGLGDDGADPLVVIDDCAISGSRFARFLASRAEADVVFASLCSHPELRAAIEARDARVRACVSAIDLSDNARAVYGDGYEAWLERWRERTGAQSAWIGLPEHVCFPWNEPDTAIWNPETEREERAWNLVPPRLCLKNRVSRRASSITVQVRPLRGPTWRGTTDTIASDDGDRVYVGHLATARTYELDDVSAAMWRALLATPDTATAAEQIASAFAVDPVTATSDLEAFARDLVGRGLIEAVPG